MSAAIHAAFAETNTRAAVQQSLPEGVNSKLGNPAEAAAWAEAAAAVRAL
eukprot:CAMPEP_0183805088 /NCGR_PEP_ID=MMETSP0803_2-20130417/36505_1 /TAXON_ID=195967 /ORGANISM="Crustomastix stigmata, Strain CCMP3273" /LENGTH=49 /DNA_ID= /DNA_START= /DNA_END= /DNA_ORIENTATION=